MQLIVILLVLSLSLHCGASRYPHNDRQGRYYCPPIHQPLCASNGLNYLYFENECHLDVRNYQEKLLRRQEFIECPLTYCYPKCKPCPNVNDPVCVIDGRTQQLKEFKNPCEVEFVACSFKKYYRLLKHGPCPQRTDCSTLSCRKDYRPICVNYTSKNREFSNDCEFQKSLCANNNMNWQGVQSGPCVDHEYRKEFFEPICASNRGENRTFQSYIELQKELKTMEKNWTILYTGYCEDQRKCRGEIIKPICALLNGTTIKSFLSPCHLQEEKTKTGQNWVILYRGLCRSSITSSTEQTSEAGATIEEAVEPERETSTDQEENVVTTGSENGSRSITATPTSIPEFESSDSNNVKLGLDGQTDVAGQTNSGWSDGSIENKTEAIEDTQTAATNKIQNEYKQLVFGILNDALNPDNEEDEKIETTTQELNNNESRNQFGDAVAKEALNQRYVTQNQNEIVKNHPNKPEDGETSDQSDDPSGTPVEIVSFDIITETPFEPTIPQTTTSEQSSESESIAGEEKETKVTEPVATNPDSESRISSSSNQGTQQEFELEPAGMTSDNLEADNLLSSFGRQEKLNLALALLQELGLQNHIISANIFGKPEIGSNTSERFQSIQTFGNDNSNSGIPSENKSGSTETPTTSRNFSNEIVSNGDIVNATNNSGNKATTNIGVINRNDRNQVQKSFDEISTDSSSDFPKQGSSNESASSSGNSMFIEDPKQEENTVITADNIVETKSFGSANKLKLVNRFLPELGLFKNVVNSKNSINPEVTAVISEQFGRNETTNQGEINGNFISTDSTESNITQDENGSNDVTKSTESTLESFTSEQGVTVEGPNSFEDFTIKGTRNPEIVTGNDTIFEEKVTTESSTTLEAFVNNDTSISNQSTKENSASRSNNNIDLTSEANVETSTAQQQIPDLPQQNTTTDSDLDAVDLTSRDPSENQEGFMTTLQLLHGLGFFKGVFNANNPLHGFNISENETADQEADNESTTTTVTPDEAAPLPIMGREEKVDMALAILEALGVFDDFVNRDNTSDSGNDNGNNETLRQEINNGDSGTPVSTASTVKLSNDRESADSLNNGTMDIQFSTDSPNVDAGQGTNGTLSQDANTENTTNANEGFENENSNSLDSIKIDNQEFNEESLNTLDRSVTNDTSVQEVDNSDATSNGISGRNGFSSLLNKIADSFKADLGNGPLSQNLKNSSLNSLKDAGNNSISNQVSENSKPISFPNFDILFAFKNNSKTQELTESFIEKQDNINATVENSKPVFDFGIDAITPNNSSSNTTVTVVNSRNTTASPSNSTYRVIYNGDVYTAPASYSPTFNFITLPNENILFSSVTNGRKHSYPINPHVYGHWPIPPSPNFTTYSGPSHIMPKVIPPVVSYHNPKPNIQIPPPIKSQIEAPVNSYQIPKPNIQSAPPFKPPIHEIVVPYHSPPKYPLSNSPYSGTHLSVSTYDAGSDEVDYANNGLLFHAPVTPLYSEISADYTDFSSPVEHPSISYVSSNSPVSLPQYFASDSNYNYNFDYDDNLRVAYN